MKEEWRVIPSHLGYEASSEGRIRNKITKGIKSVTPTDKGYLKCSLYVGGDAEMQSCRVHRLVAEAFIPIPELQVNHKNGDKSDNRPDNLEWVTNAENAHHARHNGLIAMSPNAKLMPEDVIALRERFSSGDATIKGLASETGLSRTTIQALIRGRTWKHLPGAIPFEG